MRKAKTITIDDSNITVSELKISDVLDLFENDRGMKILVGVLAGMPTDVHTLITRCLDQSVVERINDFGVGEYARIEEAFREVNADFLASLPGRIETLTGAGEKLGRSFKEFVGSSGKAT